jgi:predicted exporter
VVGSLLGGVAVDYGFYLYLQPPAFDGEPYRSKVGRLIKPLLSSALTTVIGFSLLLFSELPLIRQLGVFVSAGLLSALATALLWFAQVGTPFMQTRAFARARFSGDRPKVRRSVQVLLIVGVLVALGGPWFLKWRDDIRELEIPTPDLQAEAAEVRTLFGDSSERTVFITRGRDLADTRAALARFTAWHAKENPGATLASIGNAIPALSEWQALPERLAGMELFVPALQAALERHGFDAGAFAPFFNDWQAWRAAPRPAYDEAAGQLMAALSGPLKMMAHLGPNRCWFFSVASHPPGREPPADTGTVGVSGLENMNQLFGRYRVSALRLSAWGLGLVGLSMLILYGPWRGARIFSLPLGSCLFAFGLLGVAGQTLNLFHLLGAFLGVCLSHNYAIFTAENAARGEEQPPSIRLSALTTAASFGILALSEIPVVKALGATVALIVLTALVAVELVPLARRPISSK